MKLQHRKNNRTKIVAKKVNFWQCSTGSYSFTIEQLDRNLFMAYCESNGNEFTSIEKAIDWFQEIQDEYDRTVPG